MPKPITLTELKILIKNTKCRVVYVISYDHLCDYLMLDIQFLDSSNRGELLNNAYYCLATQREPTTPKNFRSLSTIYKTIESLHSDHKFHKFIRFTSDEI